MMHRSKVALVVALGVSAAALYLGWDRLADLGSRPAAAPAASPSTPEQAGASDPAGDDLARGRSLESPATGPRIEGETVGMTGGQANAPAVKDERPLPGPDVMAALARAGETIDDVHQFMEVQSRAQEERRGMLAAAFEETFYSMPESRSPEKVFEKWISARITDGSLASDENRARCRDLVQQFFAEYEQEDERQTDRLGLRVPPLEEQSLDNFSYREAMGRVQRGTAKLQYLSGYLEQTLGALNGRLADLFGPARDGRPYIEPKLRARPPR